MRVIHTFLLSTAFFAGSLFGVANHDAWSAAASSGATDIRPGACRGKGAVLLQENFDDGLADAFQPESGAWEVIEGVYRGHIAGHDVHGFSVAGEETWSDYRLELDLMTSGSVNQLIAFRMASLDDFYYVNVRADPWNDVVLTKVVAGVRTHLAQTAYFNQDETWHHLVVEVIGPNLRFTCDGSLLLDIVDHDSPILTGRIGAYVYGGNSIPYQDVYCDNVAVWEIPPPAYLLYEDFDDGVADDFQPESGAWEVVGGLYHGHVEGQDAHGFSVAGLASWTDYRLEFDVMASGSVNQQVAFRMASLNDYYYVNVRAGPWNDVVLTKVVAGQYAHLVQVAYANQIETWRHIVVEVAGADIRVTCDDSPLIDYTDDVNPILAGKIGAYVYAGGSIPHQDIYCDNFVVEAIDAPAVTSLGPTPAASGPIACGESMLLDFHYQRGDSGPEPVKGYSVRVQAGDALSFTAADFKVNSLPSASQVHYRITEHGVNDCTLDYVVLGDAPGIAVDADLFAIEFHAAGDGLAGVGISSAQLRDSANQPIQVGLTSATVTVACVPPGPVGDLMAAPGHESVTVTWHDPVAPDLDLVEIWRAEWRDAEGGSVYPEYDDAAGDVIPARPASRSEAQSDPEWVLAGTAAPGAEVFTDQVSERGVYFYELFARAASGVYGPPAAANASATNYRLGDVSGYDGLVNLSDLTALVQCYGSSSADTAAYDSECDIGPTDDGSPFGVPRTDDFIDFEDLMILGLNFNVVGSAKAASTGSPTVLLAWHRVGEQTWSLRLVRPCPDLRGLNLKIPLPAGTVQQLSAGESVRRPGASPFLMNVDSRGLDVGFMVPDQDSWAQRTGELFRVRLSVAAELDPPVVSARRADNTELNCSLQGPQEAAVPASMRLLQNCPNPFNPATTIRFSLPRAQHVSLAIYALDGRRVATLLNEALNAGQHGVVWRGNDDRGRAVASGTYVYRLRVGSRIKTRRMTLVR